MFQLKRFKLYSVPRNFKHLTILKYFRTYSTSFCGSRRTSFTSLLADLQSQSHVKLQFIKHITCNIMPEPYTVILRAQYDFYSLCRFVMFCMDTSITKIFKTGFGKSKIWGLPKQYHDAVLLLSFLYL